jgi:hypothetical protein
MRGILCVRGFVLAVVGVLGGISNTGASAAPSSGAVTDTAGGWE